MIVYQTDDNGVLTGHTVADPSPLEDGVWLIPAGCVQEAPPPFTEGTIPVWTGSGWVVKNLPPPEAPPDTPPLTDAELLALERARMVVSPMQGILTLGETEWGKVLAYRETASWAERVIIDSAQNWRRTSQNIAFFGYLLGYTEEQMDDLFRRAAQVVV